MTAKEARANRYSKEDEKISYRNTFNLLVADIYNEAIKTVNRTILDDIEELITKLKAY